MSWGTEEDNCPRCTHPLEKFTKWATKGEGKRAAVYFGTECRRCGHNQVHGQLPKNADPREYGDLVPGVGKIETVRVKLTL